MTTTPTIWKQGFTANVGATSGNQSVPQTIGLRNGNILVVWEDDTNGPSPSTDVMGQIFDPEGNRVGAPFQVNSAVVAGDETGPEIVALPDGGYVVRGAAILTRSAASSASSASTAAAARCPPDSSPTAAAP